MLGLHDIIFTGGIGDDSNYFMHVSCGHAGGSRIIVRVGCHAFWKRNRTSIYGNGCRRISENGVLQKGVAAGRIRKEAVISRSASAVLRTMGTVPPAGSEVAVEHHSIDGAVAVEDAPLLDEVSNDRLEVAVCE